MESVIGLSAANYVLTIGMEDIEHNRGDIDKHKSDKIEQSVVDHRLAKERLPAFTGRR